MGGRRASTRAVRSPTCAPTACRCARGNLRRAQGGRDALDAGSPDNPRFYATRRRSPEARRRSAPPIRPDRAGRRPSRLYELIWKRAWRVDGSSRIERHPTVADGTGRTGRATGRSCSSPASCAYERAATTKRRGQPRLPRRARRHAARRPSRPSSISPSRRRVTPRRAWSSAWRSSASAGRPLMRRLCRR